MRLRQLRGEKLLILSNSLQKVDSSHQLLVLLLHLWQTIFQALVFFLSLGKLDRQISFALQCIRDICLQDLLFALETFDFHRSCLHFLGELHFLGACSLQSLIQLRHLGIEALQLVLCTLQLAFCLLSRIGGHLQLSFDLRKLCLQGAFLRFCNFTVCLHLLAQLLQVLHQSCLLFLELSNSILFLLDVSLQFHLPLNTLSISLRKPLLQIGHF
mmetsp:Transcript_25461/g.55704  ORF Transcript_25461/g.55704 Transcript_25461/m.55704 type:complete len:214 (-) Transcript_25461:570-1211(-)